MQVFLTKAPLMLRQASILPKRCFHGGGRALGFFRRSWDPFREMSLAIRDMERMQECFFDRLPALSRLLWNPWIWSSRDVPIETSADGSRMFRLELDVSRFKSEDIKVKIHDRLLTVEATNKSESSDGSKLTSEFKYQYALPEEVDPENVRSLLNANGILTLEAPLPELKPQEQKEIPIEKAKK